VVSIQNQILVPHNRHKLKEKELLRSLCLNVNIFFGSESLMQAPLKNEDYRVIEEKTLGMNLPDMF
jgi:hypothetical protein